MYIASDKIPMQITRLKGMYFMINFRSKQKEEAQRSGVRKED